jgi:RNA-directed DNA polymerase
MLKRPWRNIAYTRYVDDFTFSSTNRDRLVGTKQIVSDVVKEEGFEINEAKTRFMGPATRKAITGLIIETDGEHYGIGRVKERKLRSQIWRLVNTASGVTPEDMASLRGSFSYVRSVDTKRYNRLKNIAKKCLPSLN